MKSLSAVFLALVLQTVSAVQVPQKCLSRLCQKTSYRREVGGLEDVRKRLIVPFFPQSYIGFTLLV